jgi:predicted NBD/HSP70 family sugar kinase
MHLLFDIGGTHTRVALSKNGTAVNEVLVIKTPAKFKDGMAAIQAMGEQLLAGGKPKTVAGGVASHIQYKNGKLMDFIQPDWTGRLLKPALAKSFHCPVLLDNDAALAAVGEAQYGAGRGKAIVAYLTVSTGIGGARVVNGKLDVNALGFEPRLQLLQSEPLKNFGSLSSGTAIQAIYKKPGEKLQDKKAWKDIELWMTMGINNVMVLWSPEVLVVGGPVALNKNISFKRIEQKLQKNLKLIIHKPRLVKPKWKNLSVLYGALAMIKQNPQP